MVEACNGYEAIELMNESIDLVLLDIMMPGIDGYETCKQLRIKTKRPIIFISALSEDQNQVMAYELGADDYITKPFSATYLQARVENLLMQRKKLQSFYRDSLMHIHISAGQEDAPVATDVPSAEEDTSETVPATLEMSPNDRKFMDNWWN